MSERVAGGGNSIYPSSPATYGQRGRSSWWLADNRWYCRLKNGRCSGEGRLQGNPCSHMSVKNIRRSVYFSSKNHQREKGVGGLPLRVKIHGCLRRTTSDDESFVRWFVHCIINRLGRRCPCHTNHHHHHRHLRRHFTRSSLPHATRARPLLLARVGR